MSLKQLRDWLCNLSDDALGEPAVVLVNGKLYEITNWRITTHVLQPVENAGAEIMWDCQQEGEKALDLIE